MKRPPAWLLGAFALLGFLRRRREPAAAPPADPRAEGAELTVDLAEPAPEDPASRRHAVHESARATVEQMRRR